MAAVATICLIAPALFDAILPYNVRNALLALGCVIAGGLFLKHRDFDLQALSVGFGWLAFAIFAMVDRYATAGALGFAQVALLLAALGSCFAACSTSWLRTALFCVEAMLIVHLAATLVFYVLPDLYSATVKVFFFSDNRNAIGYQSGLTSHYSDNGFLMVLGLLLSASFMLGEREGSRKWWTVLSILFLFSLILTQKRAHLLFSVFALVCLFAITSVKGKTLKFFIIAIVTFIVAAAAIAFVPGIALSFERLVGTFSAGDLAETTSGRTYLWNTAVQGWLASPFIGNGWASFLYVWPGGNVSVYAHNEILQILNDVGLLGLVLFAVLAASSFVLVFKNAKLISHEVVCDPTVRAAAFFSFSLQIFLLVYACTTGSLLQQPIIYIPFFFTVAIGLALRYSLRWHGKKAYDNLRSL